MAKPIETLSPTDEAIFRTATLKALQGTDADPNRIGAEFLPEVALDFAPLAVANATARKLAATFTTAEVTVANGIKVIQDDLPDVVWVLLDASDITVDANWAGVPRTNPSGQLPLSGVMLNTGNYTYATAERLLPVTDENTRWLTGASGYAVEIAAGAVFPGELIALGNKVSFTGQYRLKKSATGISTVPLLVFGPTASFVAGNPFVSGIYAGISPTANAPSDVEGAFQVVFTLTEVTGYPTKLRLVADTDLADVGRIFDLSEAATDITTLLAKYLTLPAASSTNDATNGPHLYTIGEDTPVSLGLQATNATIAGRTFDLSGQIGFRIFAP
jgi:hypothetical protein